MQYFADAALQPRIELDALLHDYQLGLVVTAGGDDETGAREVQWVHSSDLTDPTPFLTPRTVLLTTGEQFVGPLSKEDADAYVSRLVAAGTTALGVAIGLRWDRIPPHLVESCERHSLPLIRVPYDTPFIAITRAAARLIESSMHAQNIDRMSNSRLAPTAQIARAESALRTAVISLLIAGHRELAEKIADPIIPRLPRGQVTVIALRPSEGSLDRTKFGDGITWGVLDGQTLLVCESAQLSSTRKLVVGRAAGQSERGSLQDLRELVDQADRALEHSIAASLNTADSAELVEYRPAMHSGVLQLIAESKEAKRRAAGFLSPIRTHDLRHNDEIERSLEVWLRHNGQLAPSAAELAIHRHTLRARIRTAASLLQRDVDSPDTRAELWTALRITEPGAGTADATKR